MKILHITNFDRVNGLYEAVTHLAMAQRAVDNDVVKVITGKKSSLVDGDLVKYVRSIKDFKSFLDVFPPDICIFHSMYEYVEIFLPRVLKERGIPYIITYHGGASKDNAKKGRLKKMFADWLIFRSFIRKADAVVYLNQGEYERSKYKLLNNNYYIIPNGIILPNRIDEKHTGIINISYISRIDIWGKGLDVLCDAIKILKAKEVAKQIHFDFYGQTYNGSHHIFDEFGEFAKYHGVVLGSEKDKALNAANIMILPSRSEGMPISILEAFAYGVPCIVTPQTNMANLVIRESAGWVSVLDARELATCIENAVYEYKLRKDFFIKRCIQLSKKYDWNNIAKQSIDIYSRMLNKQA